MSIVEGHPVDQYLGLPPYRTEPFEYTPIGINTPFTADLTIPIHPIPKIAVYSCITLAGQRPLLEISLDPTIIGSIDPPERLFFAHLRWIDLGTGEPAPFYDGTAEDHEWYNWIYQIDSPDGLAHALNGKYVFRIDRSNYPGAHLLGLRDGENRTFYPLVFVSQRYSRTEGDRILLHSNPFVQKSDQRQSLYSISEARRSLIAPKR